jgi:hypothetical protein
MTIQSYSRAMDQYEGGTQNQCAIDLSPLWGTWINFDKKSRGTARIILALQNDGLQVHAFGAYSPELCDWGTVPATAFTESVSAKNAIGFRAIYDFGFLETMLAAYLNKRLLVVDSYNRFRDGSGRSQYFLRDHFYQEDRPSST